MAPDGVLKTADPLRILVLAGFALLGCSTAAAALAESASYRLSMQDQALVGKAACSSVGTAAGQLEARNYRTPRRIEVKVQCLPHRTEESLPVVHLSTCTNRGGRWNCDTGFDALQMPLPNSTLVAVAPQGLSARTAIDLVAQTTKLTVPPFHWGAMALLTDVCRVSQAATSAVKGATDFHLDCGGGSLLVTRDCWQGRCRYFVSDAHRND